MVPQHGGGALIARSPDRNLPPGVGFSQERCRRWTRGTRSCSSRRGIGWGTGTTLTLEPIAWTSTTPLRRAPSSTSSTSSPARPPVSYQTPSQTLPFSCAGTQPPGDSLRRCLMKTTAPVADVLDLKAWVGKPNDWQPKARIGHYGVAVNTNLQPNEGIQSISQLCL